MPLPEQFVNYLTTHRTGELGLTFDNQPVSTVIGDRDLADDPAGRHVHDRVVLLGILIGIYGGWRRGSRVDRARSGSRCHLRDARVLVRDPRTDGVRRGVGIFPRAAWRPGVAA